MLGEESRGRGGTDFRGIKLCERGHVIRRREPKEEKKRKDPRDYIV